MSNQTEQSRLAQSLQAIFEVPFYDKDQFFIWERYLDVTESALEEWTKDKKIPRPILLLMIYIFIDDLNTEEGQNAAKKFKEMAVCPVDESISPHFEKLKPTVWEYMMQNPFEKSA